MSLVLGAGNQVAVAALDILHQLIIEDCVVVCKMNPVNEYYGPYIRCVLGFGDTTVLCKLERNESFGTGIFWFVFMEGCPETD